MVTLGLCPSLLISNAIGLLQGVAATVTDTEAARCTAATGVHNKDLGVRASLLLA